MEVKQRCANTNTHPQQETYACIHVRMYLEEASCLQLEHKLVMHLVSWLVLAEACPFIKQHHHLLAQPWGVCVIPQ